MVVVLNPRQAWEALRRQFAGRLRRGAAGTLVLKITAVGLGFATNIALARALGTTGYGGYAFALVWVNLLILPATLGFNKLLVRDVAVAVGRQRWSLIRGLQRASNAIGLGVSLLLGAMIWSSTVVLVERLDPAYVGPLRAAALLLPIMTLVRLRTASMVGLQRVIAGHLPEWLVRPLLYLGLLLAAIALGEQLTATRAMLLNVATMGVAFIIGAWMLWRAWPAGVRTEQPEYHLRAWLASSLPFALLTGLQLLNTRVDIIMLGAMAGPEPVGMYNVAMQGASLLLFGLGAVNMAVSPVLARLWSEGDVPRMQAIVTRSARAITLFSLPMAAGLCLFATEFLWLFGEAFTAARTVLIILVLTELINVVFGSVGVLLTMTGHERLAAWGAGLAMLVNVALNWLLIPRYGMEGAATASLATMLVWNLLFAFWIWRRLGIVPSVIGARSRGGK